MSYEAFTQKYREGTRHWSSVSESYSGLDALVGAIEHGWQMEDVVYQGSMQHLARRVSIIFHFLLHNEAQATLISIVTNPAVERFIKANQLEVIPIEEMALPQEWMAATARQTISVNSK